MTDAPRPAGPGPAPKAPYVHASAVVIKESGVLILGPSGAGKSSLAFALIAAAEAAGFFARLIGDDRIRIEHGGGHLIARGHPLILGQIEARGQGVLGIPYVAGAVVGLVVDLSPRDEVSLRFPDEGADRIFLEGVCLPCMRPPRGLAASDLALSVLRHIGLQQHAP